MVLKWYLIHANAIIAVLQNVRTNMSESLVFELLALLDRIDIEEESELATLRFDIMRRYGYTVRVECFTEDNTSFTIPLSLH